MNKQWKRIMAGILLAAASQVQAGPVPESPSAPPAYLLAATGPGTQTEDDLYVGVRARSSKQATKTDQAGRAKMGTGENPDSDRTEVQPPRAKRSDSREPAEGAQTPAGDRNHD